MHRPWVFNANRIHTSAQELDVYDVRTASQASGQSGLSSIFKKLGSSSRVLLDREGTIYSHPTGVLCDCRSILILEEWGVDLGMIVM